MVRCDLCVTFKDKRIIDDLSLTLALPTIKYLHGAGAKVVLASHWNPLESDATGLDMLLIADSMSQYLAYKVLIASGLVGEIVEKQINLMKEGDILLLENLLFRKEENANDPDFSKQLVAEVDYFVNDAFSISHRVLASTVGAARFTRARLAGLQFEREFLSLMDILHAPEHPFIAIVGGGNLVEKIHLLQALVHKCDKIIITGAMALTLLSFYVQDELSKGFSRPLREAIVRLLQAAEARNVDLVLPTDVWCIGDSSICEKSHAFAANDVPKGWRAIELGPTSLGRVITSLESCKRVLWIGSFTFYKTNSISEGAVVLARTLGHMTGTAHVSVAGIEQSLALRTADVTSLINNVSHSCSAFWEFLKGNNLPGVDALDRVPSTVIPWNATFKDCFLPLFVDIGSGNGHFLLNMAPMHKDSMNFLGIEMNKKLVYHCLCAVKDSQFNNLHFVAANAINSYKQLVAGYPGRVTIVAIQCPNPDFNKIETRRRMVQRSLIECILEALPEGGRIFLQSDVETVILKMRREFERYGKGKVILDSEHHNDKSCDEEGWLKNNPFDIPTDWERHVLAKGGRMYRLMLTKVN